jgi:hypothetical protein
MLVSAEAPEVIARSCFVGTEVDPSELAADARQKFGYAYASVRTTCAEHAAIVVAAAATANSFTIMGIDLSRVLLRRPWPTTFILGHDLRNSRQLRLAPA